ncbi:MAG: C40 family peptidase [Verrucomicrobiaceae bacterium]|nr:C40 family peptidase [Verrucomicrobiaceae bacterium]
MSAHVQSHWFKTHVHVALATAFLLLFCDGSLASSTASGSRTKPATILIKRPHGLMLAVADEQPDKIKNVVYAANRIIGKPYKWGGGHLKRLDSGYDCSGAISYALSEAGIIPGSKHCREYLQFGRPGKGRWLTLWVHEKHIFMTIFGRTFDVCVNKTKTGPRWVPTGRSTAGFQPRHIPGL